jgi:ABC-type transport system substrate-binding protein
MDLFTDKTGSRFASGSARGPSPRWTLAALGLVLAGSLAGCSGGGGTSGAGTGSVQADANGILRYGYDLGAQSTNFDPAKSVSDCDAIAIQPVYDTLIHRDLKGNLVPALAESWQLQGQTLTLHLRPGVKFQDGTAFDAGAVKQGLLHNKTNTSLNSIQIIDSIDVVDPLTLRLNLHDLTGVQLLYAFTQRDGMIVAPSALTNASQHPVGAGPFTFVSFAPGARISLRANANYWAKGTYHFGGIDLIQVGTGPPAVTALKAGSVDLIRFEAESYQGLKADPNVGVAVQNSPAYLQFQFRFAPPFDNLKVRQAVEYAVDKDQINTVVQDGLGEVATQPYFKASPEYNPSIAGLYHYDPAMAHQLLVQSGLTLPVNIQMVIPGGNITNMERQGAILQQELDAAGFNVSIKRILGSDIEVGYYLSKQGNAFAAEKLGEAFPPNLLYGSYGKDQFVAIWSNGENPDITKLMLQALSTSDNNLAASLTQQANALVMQNALEVPIAFAPQMVAYGRNRVAGVVHGQTNICDPPDLSGVLVKKG